MGNLITVKLDGRRYRISADEDLEYMNRVIDYVNGQISDMRQGDSTRTGVDMATLAALNIADSLFKERSSTEGLRQQLKEALDNVRALEAQLGAQGKTPAAPAKPRGRKPRGKAAAEQLTLDDNN